MERQELLDLSILDLLKEIYDLIAGPYDDPVIDQELYDKIENTLKKYNKI